MRPIWRRERLAALTQWPLRALLPAQKGGSKYLFAGRAIDWTLAFRGLTEAASGNEDAIPDVGAWYDRWKQRLSRETIDAEQRASAMRRVNPAFIPRNHRVEAALSAAVERNDYEPFNTLLKILERPFDDQPEFADFRHPGAIGSVPYRTFCGT